MRADVSPLTVAIVGCGPKGLFALDALARHAGSSAAGARVAIDVYEPHPFPGAGPVYDPRQPPYLLMNFASSLIDAWGSDGADRAPWRRTFEQWWSDRHGAPPSLYAARADVGSYLADAFRRVCDHLPDAVTVRVIADIVTDVSSDAPGWRLRAGTATQAYDEVLVATGHATSWPGALDRARPGVTGVFPVDVELAPDRVAPGSRVAVRGFALTFIDAAIALTEGRGGRFVATPGAAPLAYARSGAEPAVILPYSRTGRPILAKPPPVAVPAVVDAVARGSGELAALRSLDLVADVVPVLARTTDAVMTAVGANSEATREWWEGACAGRDPVPGDRLEVLSRSCDVADGMRPPDRACAMGQIWRGCYPQIVARLGHGGLAADDLPRFHRLAAVMERIAFGPPSINARKIVALAAAGIVDLTCPAGIAPVRVGDVWSLETVGASRVVDVVVDAVLAPPGVPDPSGLGATLVRAGTVRRLAGGRGLDVDANGSCRSPAGHPTLGLASVGRPTEDAVIGNDTLSRTLHPIGERWASRVARRAARTLAAASV